jgi:hypothetical protein
MGGAKMQAPLFSTTDTSQPPALGALSGGNDTLSFPKSPEKEPHRVWSFLLRETLYSPFSWSPALTTEAYLPEILEKIVPLSRPSPSFETYMKLVSTWASAFDEEAAAYATEHLESLYDDAYFEALELQKKLP